MVDTFDVTVEDVLANLPVDSSEISMTSQPVSVGGILQWIEQGAAEVATAIVNAGVSATDVVTRQQCATATISYASKKALEKMGMLGTQAYRDASDNWVRVVGSMRSNNLNEPSSSKAATNNSGNAPQWRGNYFRGF